MVPAALKLACNWMLFADNSVLSELTELKLVAPATFENVKVAEAVAEVLKISVVPWREFVPALVRSLAVPATPSAKGASRSCRGQVGLSRITDARLQRLIGD